jgi:hypothetical protein
LHDNIFSSLQGSEFLTGNEALGASEFEEKPEDWKV